MTAGASAEQGPWLCARPLARDSELATGSRRFFRRFARRDEGNQTAAARILSPPPINWPGQARLRATFVTTRQSHKRGCTIA